MINDSNKFTKENYAQKVYFKLEYIREISIIIIIIMSKILLVLIILLLVTLIISLVKKREYNTTIEQIGDDFNADVFGGESKNTVEDGSFSTSKDQKYPTTVDRIAIGAGLGALLA